VPIFLSGECASIHITCELFPRLFEAVWKVDFSVDSAKLKKKVLHFSFFLSWLLEILLLGLSYFVSEGFWDVVLANGTSTCDVSLFVSFGFLYIC
jgi:hypothetical protein